MILSTYTTHGALAGHRHDGRGGAGPGDVICFFVSAEEDDEVISIHGRRSMAEIDVSGYRLDLICSK